MQAMVRQLEPRREAPTGIHVFGPTKNYRNRTIVLPGFLRDMLNDHLVNHTAPGLDGLLFTADNGAPLRNSNFNRRVWQSVVAACGLSEDLRMHDLRHTAVALLISQGAHPEAIKRYRGHSSIAVTMDIYGHLVPTDAEDRADKLDALWRDSVTDKRRTRPVLALVDEDDRMSELQGMQGIPVAPSGRFELPTPGLGNRCSIP